MRYLILLIALSACGMDSYRPAVAQPQDVKYEGDLRECIAYSKDVRSKPDIGKSVIIGATGLGGYVALNETKDKDDVYFKNGYELTDDCLKKKGYTLQ